MISGFSSVNLVSVAEASTSVSGIITSNTTWIQANSPYNLAGNVLVDLGVTLTIEPGVTVNIGSYYIMVNGTLRVLGSSLNPVLFNGGQITITAAAIGWNNQTGSGCIIDHAITDGTPITSGISTKITDNTLFSSVATSGSSLVSDNTITGEVSASGSSMIAKNTIAGRVSVSGSSMLVNNTIVGDAVASDTCVISNNTIIGATSAVGSSVVSNNTIDGGITAQGNCIISQNRVSASETAVSVPSWFFQDGGQPTIENNIIENSTVGISISILIRGWVGANIPLVQNNLIRENEIGIHYGISRQESYAIAPTIIQNNTIIQNEIGVRFNSAEDCKFLYNNLQGNANYSLYFLGGANDLNATYNWWGTTDPQLISQSIYDYYDDFNLGRVNYAPFLNEPAIPEFPSILSMMLTLMPLLAATLLLRKRFLKITN